MIFNSFIFLFFFVAVFFFYYFPLKGKTKAQNWLLLLSSYFFYGFADWKMIPLLLVVTIITFFLGTAIHKTTNPRKSSFLTILGVLLGIGLLVYFKYFNFFIDSFSTVLNSIGLKTNPQTFNIIMPLGISFFTFKFISYVIEIHREKIEPSRDFVAFSTYIAFFPTILSGPIDRPNNFIPQLQKKRSFNYDKVVDGCKLVLWGMFQKIVIADNLAGVIDKVWDDIPDQSGSVLFGTAILYSIQIYTDFSGYSNMAIGIGKILGFDIAKNFNYPFFARNISEFWRKWHMSLTSWLTDYVFMPLNIKFRNLGPLGMILAIIINMVVVGMWHGASWTFVVFGLYHGLLFIPLILSGAFLKNRKLKPNKYGLPIFKDFSKMTGTYLLVTIGFVIFRADSIGQTWEYFSGIFNLSRGFLNYKGSEIGSAVIPLIFSVIMFILEWYYRETQYPLANLGINWCRPLRYAMYYAIIIAVFWFGGKEQQFIYFQF